MQFHGLPTNYIIWATLYSCQYNKYLLIIFHFLLTISIAWIKLRKHCWGSNDLLCLGSSGALPCRLSQFNLKPKQINVCVCIIFIFAMSSFDIKLLSFVEINFVEIVCTSFIAFISIFENVSLFASHFACTLIWKNMEIVPIFIRS